MATGQKAELVLTDEEKKAAKHVPSWKATLLDVVTEKVKLPRETGDLHWHYAFEVSNLIDGKRWCRHLRDRAGRLPAGEVLRQGRAYANQLLAGWSRRHRHPIGFGDTQPRNLPIQLVRPGEFRVGAYQTGVLAQRGALRRRRTSRRRADLMVAGPVSRMFGA
jgi:hypothetical protein